MNSLLRSLFSSIKRAFPVTLFLVLPVLPGEAQQPDTLRNSIPAPASVPTGFQRDTKFGQVLATDGGLVVVGAPYEDLTVDDDGGVARVLEVATGKTLYVLKNPNPTGSNFFGFSVAISGTRVVVGCSSDSTGGVLTGRAYVYDLSSATPTIPTAILNPPYPNPNTQFGLSVKVSGNFVAVGGMEGIYVYDVASATPTTVKWSFAYDWAIYVGRSFDLSGSRVVVSQYTYNSHADGKLYVYDVTSPTPHTPVWSITNHAGLSSPIFRGNYIAVVALGESIDTYMFGANRVFLYDITNSSGPLKIINRPEPLPFWTNDTFYLSAFEGTLIAGTYTSSSGQKRSMMYDTASADPNVPISTLGRTGPMAFSNSQLLLGDTSDSTAGAFAGAVTVYDSANVDTPLGVLTSPAPLNASGSFGYSVALSGASMIVGAKDVSTAVRNTGCAYVYDLLGATPSAPRFTLQNPSPKADENFGNAVAIAKNRAAVAAVHDDTTGMNAGSVYVYDFDRPVPTEPWLVLSNPTSGADEFGTALAMAGNYVVVGAPLENTGAIGAGSAYIYDLSSPSPTVPALILHNPAPLISANFGNAVAISGKIVVVGVELDDVRARDSGRVYVYDLSSPTPAAPIRTLDNPKPSNDDRFGHAVGVSGTRIVVGSAQGDNAVANAGSVFVYDLTATTTIPQLTLNNPNPSAFDLFGSSLSISGARIAVGAAANGVGAVNAGSTFVFDLAGASPATPVVTVHNPTPNQGDGFGHAVALAGTTLAIGAPVDGTVGYHLGFAYVYAPSNPDWDGDGELDLYEYATYGDTEGHNGGGDPDGTVAVNLIAHAFDRDPKVTDAATGGALTIESGYLTMTITKQPGVTYLVQSGDSPANESFSAASTTVLTDNPTTLKVRDNFFVGDRPQRVLRVKLTAGP